MKKVRLGRTGLDVTQLGYGALEVRGTPDSGGGRMPNEEHASKILNAVLDSGINFIDTAWCYGRSEEMMGRYIAERRDEYVLAAKAGHGRCNATRLNGYTRDDIMTCIEETLERLRTDHVDILQLHNPTPEDVEANGSIEALQEIKAQGMTRFIGVSSVLPHLEKHLATDAYDVFQIPYSALERRHDRMLQQAADAGAGIIVRGGIAQGHRGNNERWAKWEQAGLDGLLDGMSRYEFMLRFTLSHAACHTTIVGTGNPDHFRSNIAAAPAGPLPADVYAQVKERLDQIGEEPED